MIEPIDKNVTELVTYTANEICKEKGHSVRYHESDVEIILQSVRLVNSLSGIKNDAG